MTPGEPAQTFRGRSAAHPPPRQFPSTRVSALLFWHTLVFLHVSHCCGDTPSRDLLGTSGACPAGTTAVDTFAGAGGEWTACEDFSLPGGAISLVQPNGQMQWFPKSHSVYGSSNGASAFFPTHPDPCHTCRCALCPHSRPLSGGVCLFSLLQDCGCGLHHSPCLLTSVILGRRCRLNRAQLPPVFPVVKHWTRPIDQRPSTTSI